MKMITFDRIVEANISVLQCYEWVSEALSHKSQAVLPAKISLKPDIPGVFYNTMPVIVPETGFAGVKLVTRYPENSPALESKILLYDLKTGENVALMDGTWITTMRTGGVAAHSIQLLAVSGFSVLGFIGLGNTARATLEALEALFPNRELVIKLKKYKNQHEQFAERFSDYGNLKFVYCDTYEEVIRESDVIVSAATVLDEDIGRDEWFQEGVLVVPVHTRGFTNCDLFFDRIFADDESHVANFKYYPQFRSFAEVADVITGKKPGRKNDKERIIVYNIGIALHDIYFAGKIYEMIGEACEDIPFLAPREKIWV